MLRPFKTPAINRTLAACCFLSLLATALACRHQATITSIPTASPTATELASMQPDQVNTAGWNSAWTNLLNDAEQSFTPTLPKLVAVEVQLIVGNADAAEDELTLVVLDASGQTLATVTLNVQAAHCDHVMFIISRSGVEVSPGQTYRLRLLGGAMFGWKYAVGGYERGQATFNGKPLLADARSTFLFRTFGAQ